MEFRILGPLEVVHQGRGLALGRKRERALLALLLLSANRVVSAERLAEDLWAGQPPEGANPALRVFVSRLRKALREGGGEAVLVTRDPGYLVQVDPQSIDAVRFEVLVARGREAAAVGDHAGAASTLRAALALWRGAALADVADAPFARAEVARLEEARLAALEERVQADLACGRHDELVGELSALTDDHPLRERLWQMRMLALYRSGRQAEALRAYQELRRLLAEELGLEPGEALRRLEAAILRHDPALDRQPGSAAAVAVPALLTEMGRIFIGRERELERLGQLWKEAEAGQLRLALVAGEPGVGKTRLAAEVAGRVHAAGALVLAGRCDEDLGVPYQPFVEALRHFVHNVADLRLGRHRGELVRLVPELADRVPDLPPPLRSDPETERYRLFNAVAEWLASVERPVLLVLDDLQWAAKPTLHLLRHVVRSPQLRRILVVGIYRDTELGYDHPLIELLADLRRQGGVERLSLSGLDEAGVVAFMEQAAGHDLDDEDLLLARAIHDETEGIPFFVREVLRHLAETGAVERRHGRWTTRLPLEELGIPEGVREVVGRRLSHLSKEANRVLRLAAVVGPEFELAVIRQVEGLGEEELVSALEEASRARLVIEVAGPDPRYRFAHALVRDTLYGELSAPRRVALHRRVAESVETVHAAALDDYLPALAHHWARAAAPAAETSKAVDYAARAGDRALAQLAHDEAAAYYRDALELLGGVQGSGHEARRLELLISLGEAQRRAGDPAHRENLLAAGRLAAASGDADALGRAAVANNRGLHSVSGQVDAERVAVLEAALEAVGPGDSSQRARLLGVLAAELGFSSRHEHRERLSTDALNMARRLGDLAILGDVLARRWAVLSPSDPEERARELTELSTVAAELGDPTLAFWGRYWGWMTALVLADKEGLAAALDDAARLADEIGQPFYHWVVGFIRSTQGRIAGRLAEAEARAEETLELGNIGGAPDAFQMYGANIFWIRYDQGRLDEVVDLLRRGVARPSHNPLTEAALAVALCELDCWDEARVVYNRLAASEFAVLPRNFLWFYGLTLSAEACAGLGDVDGAVTLRRLLSPYGNRVAQAGSGATGAIAHYLALLATALGHFDEAETHFAAAETTHARIGAPTWLARTRLEWARMLLNRRQPGDADRARGLLGQVLTSAQELGLGNVERRAAALLGPVEQGMGE